jgi:hypothetical protein
MNKGGFGLPFFRQMIAGLIHSPIKLYNYQESFGKYAFAVQPN